MFNEPFCRRVLLAVCLTTMFCFVQPLAEAKPPAVSPDSPAEKPSMTVFPPLTQPVTSFGGAVAGDYVYIYGGHKGGAHAYSNKLQGNTLLQLNLADPKKWVELATGPRLQGLALVGHGKKIYRLGGFTAKNKAGEENDLWSQSSVAVYDPATDKWTDMPPLPEPRSSFDAAVIGDTIYVAGGWQLAGEAESVWHKTAWKLDLTAKAPAWQALPAPPFTRRALALAAYDNKLFVIGGMDDQGEIYRQTAIFDPATSKWSTGPEIPAKGGMTGFGSSAFATGGVLYVSTIDGDLYKLSGDQSKWQHVKQLPTARFFHRMLPTSDSGLMMIGGASMESGKFKAVENIDVK